MPEVTASPEFIEERSTAIRVGTLGLPGTARVRVTGEQLEIRTGILAWRNELLSTPLSSIHSIRVSTNGLEVTCEVTLRDREEKYLFTTSEPQKLIDFLRAKNVVVNVESLPNPKAASLFRKAEQAWIYVAGILAAILGLFFLAVGIAWLTAKG